jgi:hypothetical protein
MRLAAFVIFALTYLVVALGRDSPHGQKIRPGPDLA